MAQRLGALLLLGVALAATSGLVHKAGGAPARPVAAELPRLPGRIAPATCPIPHRYRYAFKYAAQTSKIPLPLLYAVTWVESHLDPNARSAAGARGIAQILPSTARAMGIENYDDPDVNIVAGARYLREMLDRFRKLPHPVDLALAAYNAGPTAVAAAGGAPNSESLSYVANVKQVWQRDLRAVLAC
jgi:soluble lytic murein transglycosylase-like protein